MAEPHVEPLVASIESAMRQACELHGVLLELLHRKRKALGTGDTDAMTDLCKLENEQVQKISELEKARMEQAAKLTLLLVPDAPEPMPLRDLALKLPPPLRDRLMAQRQRLRDRMLLVREQTSIAKRATEALLRHVQGLVRTISTFAAGGASYGSHGDAPRTASAVSTINLVA